MTYPAEVLADSPWGYWKLDETSGGTFADSSGNGRDASESNGSVGAKNQAKVFPSSSGGSFQNTGGSNANVLRSLSGFPAGAFTFEMSVNPTSINSGSEKQGLIYAGGDGTVNMRVSDSGRPAGEFDLWINGAKSQFGSSLITNGTPAHIVLVCPNDGATATKVYINNTEVFSGVKAAITLSGNDVEFLKDGNNFLGYFQDFAIYPSALSPTRVGDHYTALNVIPLVSSPASRLKRPVNASALSRAVR